MMDRPHISYCKDPKGVELFDSAVAVIDDEPDKAESYMREAVVLGCTASMVLLGDILIDGNEEEKKEAISLFRNAYEGGDNMGSRNLGYCFALGLGVEQDKKKAAEWYERSAREGNAKAQCNLGVLYEYGHGVEQDYSKAAEWFKKSAENGYHRGRTNYACLLRDGKGVERNPIQAVYWFEKSGSPRAKRLLALMYITGDGIDWNREKARELLEEASEKDRKAMFILGDMIYDENRERAVALFMRSAEKGYEDAIKRLTELGLEVPPRSMRF